jgi:protein-disulfide isomerase
MTASRRTVLAGLASAALIASGTMPSCAQAIKSDLPDLVIGNPAATVTIEEFASLTCSHCATFHNTVYPALKKAYIDTGKVKLIYRDFPINELSVGAALLTRCGGGVQRENLVGALFKTQEAWSGPSRNPLVELYKIGQQVGFPQADMEKCLSDEILFAAIVAQRDEYEAKYKIEGTPTFFINGKLMEGRADMANFDKALAPLVKK